MKLIRNVLLVAALTSFVTTATCSAQSAPSTPETIAQQKIEITKLLDEKYQRSDIGSKSWSTAYHTCITVSVVFAALAALLAKLGTPAAQKKRNNLIAILAATAALTTTLNTTLKFNQKWVANRTTRTALDKLRVDMTEPVPNLDEIRKRFKDTMTRHEEMLTK